MVTSPLGGFFSRLQALRAPRGPQRWVGLDFGSRSIKLVELERVAGKLRLVKSLVQELPVGPDAKAVDRIGWLQSALKEFDAKELHVSLGGPEVAIRRVPMPLMPKAELREAVKWQIKEQISFPVQDAVLDARVIGEVWDKDIKKQDVIVAAASRAAVQETVTLVDRAGARVASLTPTHACLWRCITSLMPEASQGSVAVIEIGAGDTEVTIAKDGQIRLVRDLAIGSASVTEALVGVVSSEGGNVTIDSSKAETLKRRYGVLTDATEGTTEEGVPLFHLSSLMRPVLEHLLTELSRVFDFYKLQMEEAGVSRVLLCGGGAAIKQLQPYLADGLGVTVEIFNPLVRLGERVQPLEPEQIAEGGPRLGVAIGLALDHGEGFNLLPAEHRAASSLIARQWLPATKAVAAGVVALYVGLQAVAGWLGLSIRTRQAAWMHLEPSYTQCMQLITNARTLDDTVNQSQRFTDQQPLWDGAFKALGAAMPESIELDMWSVRAEPDESGDSRWQFRVTGQAASGRSPSEGSIATLLEALERSSFFSQVKLVSSEMRGVTQFTIEGILE